MKRKILGLTCKSDTLSVREIASLARNQLNRTTILELIDDLNRHPSEAKKGVRAIINNVFYQGRYDLVMEEALADWDAKFK